MNQKSILLIPLVLLYCTVLQSAGQTVPEQYLQQALADNAVLKEKKISLEKSLVALKTAKSLFLPTTFLEGQYLLSKGGRAIDIPVGDLLNPVYKSLNQLTGNENFRQISNVSEQFNPNNFYDVRIKTTMPLINADLKINREIANQQLQMQEVEVDTYKRELVKEVKTAYYNYLLAGKAIAIYGRTMEVVKENLRVNQSLLNNGKGLPAYVSRAESEVKSVESQLQTAINEQQNAKAYFNFLLNKPFSDSIIADDTNFSDRLLPFSDTAQGSIDSREELKSLALSKAINQNVLKMNEGFRKPKLNAFVDLASQGFDFKVNSKSFLYLGGLQLQIPIYAGKRNLYKIDRAKLDAKAIDVTTANTSEQLKLAAFVSKNNITTARNNYLASLKQQEAAQKYFKLIDKGFTEGVNTFIEFLDARNQLTNAALQVNINQFRVLSAKADYERQTASYILK